MGEEYTAKTFKSGNSVAMRLPKGLGIKEGVEMKVREERGRFIVEPVEPVEAPKRKIDVSKFWGVAAGTGLELIKPEERIFEHRPLLWENPEWMVKFGKGE